MADTPTPGGPIAEAVRHFAPYAPVFGGAVLSMAFGERLTIRGKLVSAGAGLAAALWIAPFLCDLAALFWPGDELPRSVVAVIGFACGAFGMIVLSGLAQFAKKYSADPLKLVRIQVGGVIITGGSTPPGEQQ